MISTINYVTIHVMYMYMHILLYMYMYICSTCIVTHLRIPVRAVLGRADSHHGVRVCLIGTRSSDDPSPTSRSSAPRTFLVGGVRVGPSTCDLVKVFVHHLHRNTLITCSSLNNDTDCCWFHVPACRWWAGEGWSQCSAGRAWIRLLRGSSLAASNGQTDRQTDRQTYTITS